MQQNQTVENYVCSLIDILGQKEKLVALNDFHSVNPTTKAAVDKILKDTYVSVEKFRKHMCGAIPWINAIKNEHSKKTSFSSNDLKFYSFSDLVVSYVSLRDNSNENGLKFESIYFLLMANGIVFLQMLSDNIALRGGIDIGIGVSHSNGEIYGNALSNAYMLESEVAKSIRIIIGEKLYKAIEKISSGEVESNEAIDYNISYAKMCKELIQKDFDGEYILDYLSESFKGLEYFDLHSKKARVFLETECSRLKINCQSEIAKKYVEAIKYFEKSGVKA
ncbi:MAG: hypothetical protein RBR33_01150 [Sulfurovaceae bacterium]|nr:hypothetical protein [Sulfurovaceae bacterium]